jgi:hydroxymethylpyrimidine/phosphomethylpyrimidine kinase
MGKPRVVWTIAGFDPTSGAGITADLKTIASLNCYGAACITALTVQNTQGVRRVEPVTPATVHDTLRALVDDLPPSSIKIGMLARADIVSIVADFLDGHPTCPVVLDPVLRASSGAELLDDAGVYILRERLLPRAAVVTPNRSEASILTGLPIDNSEAMAIALRQLGATAAVVTGGDSCENQASDDSQDVLAYSIRDMDFVETLSAPRQHSSSTHGTGCAFSTAIACALALGQNIPTAVTSAKAFVSRAIELAPGLGGGNGPMGLEHAGRS